MGTATDLLRMLEPAVRPAGIPGASRPAPSIPIESESFESLLDKAHAISAAEATPEAEAIAGDPEQDDKAKDRVGAGRAGHLGLLNRIDNSSLRVLLAGDGPTAATA